MRDPEIWLFFYVTVADNVRDRLRGGVSHR